MAMATTTTTVDEIFTFSGRYGAADVATAGCWLLSSKYLFLRKWLLFDELPPEIELCIRFRGKHQITATLQRRAGGCMLGAKHVHCARRKKKMLTGDNCGGFHWNRVRINAGPVTVCLQ